MTLPSPKALTLFWILSPLLAGAMALWDGLQTPMNIWQFMGATNNFILLFLFAVAVVAPLWLFRAWRAHRVYVFSWMALLAWALLGLWANATFHVFTIALWLMMLGVAGLGVATRTHTKPPNLRVLTLSLLALTAMLGVSVGVHLLGAWPTRQIFLYVDGWGNIRTFGEAALLAWLGLMGICILRPRPLVLIGIVVSSVWIWWSGTRAAWVGMVLAWGVVVVTTRAWTAGGLIIGATLLGLALSLFLPLPGKEYGAWRIDALAQETTESVSSFVGSEPAQTQSDPSSARVRLWSWGWEKTLERPLLGHGVGAMSQDTTKPESLSFFHLHNIVLDLAYWFGWPVAALVLGWMSCAWVTLVHASAQTSAFAPYLAIATGLAVCALFAGTLMFPLTLTAFVVSLSVAKRTPSLDSKI